MFGGMQDFALRVPRLIDHAEREHGGQEIVSHWADGSQTRTNWAGIARDARRLAQALERLGLKPGDRVATLGMNHARHLTAWYGTIWMKQWYDAKTKKLTGIVPTQAQGFDLRAAWLES